MKIVHTADLHIGLETHGPLNPQTGLSRRLEDFLASLDGIVSAAISEPADLVIMAGDIYKSREPSPTHQRLFARRLLRLSQAGIPVFLLAGNHDVPNTLTRATSIDIFRTLEVPSVTVAHSAQVYEIATGGGPCLVASLPWMTRNAILADEGARSLPSQELELYMSDRVQQIAVELATEIEELRADPRLREAPAILVAHVHAAEARDGAERMLTVGTDPLVPINKIALDTFDYVALGHIHAHQILFHQPPAVYPGSIERVNFGEEHEEKGYVLADVQRGRCDWEFRALAARRFVTIDVNAPTDDPTEATLHRIERHAAELPDAIVRVRIKLSAQNQALFDESRVRAALASTFWVAEVQRIVDRPARVRLAGTSVEGKQPGELLEDYFSQKGLPQDERDRLRVYAQRLLNQRDVA